MQRRKIKNYEIIPPTKSAFTIETDDDFPKLHTLTLASAVRGSGKTTAVVNLIRKGQQKGYFDRCIIITPTYYSNQSLFDLLDYNTDDVMEPTRDVLEKVKDILEDERMDWEEYLDEKEIYEDYLYDRVLPVEQINPYKLITYYDKGLLESEITKKPVWKYKHERPPSVCVLIDDCMGTDLMTKRSAGLTRFIIAHRHWSKGLGCSVFMLTQSYCSHDGVARPIRENCTNLMLWKVKDEKQRKKIIEEAGLDVTEQEFGEMLDYATGQDYGFLMVDFQPKCTLKQFRCCFNEYLTCPSMKCKCKQKK